MIKSENIIRNICENYEDAETLLLEAMKSDDEDAYEAKLALIQLYGTGHLVMEDTDTIEIPRYPNIEKLKSFVANEIEDETDVRNMVYSLYYDFIYHNFGEMPNNVDEAIEAALDAVKCTEEDYCEDEGKCSAKIILFSLYYEGEYESDNSYCNICCPSLKDPRKIMKLLRYDSVMIAEYSPRFAELKNEGELDEILEEAYSIYPDKNLLARFLIERYTIAAKVDKIIETIKNADQQLASLIAMDILDEWEYYFDYGDSKYTPEIIEKIILAFADKGAYVEFLLSLYQFGCAKIIGAFGDYEVSLPTLQNKEKAADYALKNGIDLLTSYAEIEM